MHADLAGTSSAGTSHADLAGTSLADTDLAAAALARGIKVQPLSWHAQRPCEPGLLLGYAASPPAVIAAAIAVLGELARGAGP